MVRMGQESNVSVPARTSDEKPEIVARHKLGLQSFVWGDRRG